MRSRSSATAFQYQAGSAVARASKPSYVAMSCRAMNRRRRERSRYAWLGVQATASSLLVSDPVRSLTTAPDIFNLRRTKPMRYPAARLLPPPRRGSSRRVPSPPTPSPVGARRGGLLPSPRSEGRRVGDEGFFHGRVRSLQHEPLCFGVIREWPMVWKRLFGKNRVLGGDSPTSDLAAAPEPDGSGISRRRPPAADPAMQSRLDA